MLEHLKTSYLVTWYYLITICFEGSTKYQVVETVENIQNDFEDLVPTLKANYEYLKNKKNKKFLFSVEH